MKKILLPVLVILLAISTLRAQHCAQASVNIPTRVGTTAGLTPYPENLPCMVFGQQVDDTIYFHNFSTFALGPTSVTVDSLKIDSIGNLPAGLCWVSNKPSNKFAGGEDGIIYVHGVCTGQSGQYKLKILFEAETSLGNLPPNSDAESYAGLRYYVRVRCPHAACTALDTVNGRTNPYIAYTPCIVAAISPAGAVSICPGDSQTLSATTASGNTYRWSTGATTSSIRVAAAGSYTVTVYNGGDSAVSAATTIAHLTAPVAAVTPAGPDSICQGDTLTLSATVSGLNYSWSSGGLTQSIRVTTAGTYAVAVVDNNNCSAVSAPVTVVVKPLPAAAIIRNGFTLTAGSGTGYTYQWYKDGILQTGETNATYTATANGSYTVEVTAPNGCSAMSAATSVVNVGISDINGNAAIRLYPNPTKGLLTLESSGRVGDRYDITDALGRSVQQRTITTDQMTIDMSVQTQGIYYLTIRHGAVHETIRFAVVK